MFNNQRTFQIIISILFISVLLIVVANIVIIYFFPTNNSLLLLLQPIIILASIILLFLMSKRTSISSKEISKSNQRLNNIFDSLDVAIWSHDLKSNLLLITPGIQNLYGFKIEEFYKDPLLWKKVIYNEDLNVLEEREQVITAGQPCTTIYRIVKPDGQVRWIQDRGIPTIDESGKLVYFTSVLFDITDRKESENRYKSLVEMSPDIVAVISNFKIYFINDAGSKVLGATSPIDLVGKEVSRFIRSEDIKNIKKRLELKANGREYEKLRFDLGIIRLDGQLIEVEFSFMPILYEGRTAIQVVGRDITERKKAERMIHNMAYYDSLTGIPNRNMFMERIKDLLSNQEILSFAILFLDLDRFKLINDTKGHSIGDLLLKEVAESLTGIVQNDGEVFRQGGDEFIVILRNVSKEKVKHVANQIINNFSTPYVINHQELFITPSIGISMYPIDGLDQESLIKQADTAMYLAKEKGKNNYKFYYHELDKITERKMDLENGLRKSLELNELKLYYQPKVELETGAVIGVEALLRWEHSILGMVSPAEFIPLAEETGLIVPIGKWVLQKATEQIKEWESNGYGTIPVAVNISMRQFQDEAFTPFLKNLLLEANLDPTLLELEITESIVQDFEKSTPILNDLKQLGLTISMDDFGTGYSSLSNLRYLPIDFIKIDKSFIDDIIDSSSDGSIVKAIIDMGHNLQFTIIAEGIESEEQVQFLINHSCSIGQGYHFSRPLPASELGHFLKRGLESSLTNEGNP